MTVYAVPVMMHPGSNLGEKTWDSPYYEKHKNMARITKNLKLSVPQSQDMTPQLQLDWRNALYWWH